VIVGVPKEIYPGERRVALIPTVVPNLAKAGFEVIVEAGAGLAAGYPDSQYSEKGARVVPDRRGFFLPLTSSFRSLLTDPTTSMDATTFPFFGGSRY
jgi:NAD/NADP transhydrogenase alpha subunit